MPIYFEDTKKGRRELARIQKKVNVRQISEDLNVTEAWVKKVDKRLSSLENASKGEDKRLDKIWKWANEVWHREG